MNGGQIPEAYMENVRMVSAAVDTYGNVTSTAIITVPRGCCFNVSVRYVAADEDPATVPTPVINAQNSNLLITRIA